MNKLSLTFIAGAITISAGLAIAQSRMSRDSLMQGHDMPDHSAMMPATPSK